MSQFPRSSFGRLLKPSRKAMENAAQEEHKRKDEGPQVNIQPATFVADVNPAAEVDSVGEETGNPDEQGTVPPSDVSRHRSVIDPSRSHRSKTSSAHQRGLDKLRLKHEMEQLELQELQSMKEIELIQMESKLAIKQKLEAQKLAVKQKLEEQDFEESFSETSSQVSRVGIEDPASRTHKWIDRHSSIGAVEMKHERDDVCREEWSRVLEPCRVPRNRDHEAPDSYIRPERDDVCREERSRVLEPCRIPRNRDHEAPEPDIRPRHQQIRVDHSPGEPTIEQYAPRRDVSEWMDEPAPDCTLPVTAADVAATAFFNQDLPKTELFTFDGSPFKWCEWNLSFKTRVHENKFLSMSKKLSFLQSSLGEGPRSKVFAYLWDERYYMTALRELKRIYGNPSVIVEAYIDMVKSWSNPSKPVEICEFSQAVSQLVQVFQILGFESDLNAHGLLTDLVKKLPVHLCKSWGKYVQRNGIPNLRQFERWLSREEEALRLGGVVPPPTMISSSSRSSSKGKRLDDVVRDTHAVQQKISPSKSPLPSKSNLGSISESKAKCAFCDSHEHFIDKCDTFLKKSGPDRLEWYKSGRRCFRCSKTYHNASLCTSRNQCRADDCSDRRRHSTVLHDVLTIKRPMDSDRSPPLVEVNSEATSYNKSETYLQTLPVRIHAPNGRSIVCTAMLDSGSQTCLINSDLAAALGLTGPKSTLLVRNVARDALSEISSKLRFIISNPNDASEHPITVPEAWTITKLGLPGQSIPTDDSGKPVWPHIQDLNLSLETGKVELLIGANCKAALVQYERISGPSNVPDAIRTPLGWTLSGGHASPSLPSPSVNFLSHESDAELPQLIRKFWSIDDFGCKYTDDRELSLEDRKCLKVLDAETRHTGTRYEVPMLFNDDNTIFSNNRLQAERRYSSLVRKLLKNPDLQEQYCAAVQKYIDNGHASKLSAVEVSQICDLTHYMVHFATFHPQKDSCRVVFDNAAPYRGESLNDKLLMGPFLTSSLVGLLMRFRIGRIALSADIEQMFHQVLVPEKQRDCLRFLWSPSLDASPDTYRMNVHVFGTKCSPCCATYALNRAILDSRLKFPDLVIDKLLRSFYMDDLITSTDTEDSAVSLMQDSITIAASGGLKLTKWTSTSEHVLEGAAATPGIRTAIDLNLSDGTPATSRVLGIRWNVSKDCFFFSYQASKLDSVPTKRSMLSQACSIFDPMGLLAPFLVRVRMLIQQLWLDKVQWDEPIPLHVLVQWQRWTAELVDLEEFELKRKYWPAEFEPIHISVHYFGDSSEKCYAACAYLRVVNASGNVHCTLVMARMRLAPQDSKRLSLPRLELQAAVMVVRLAAALDLELDLKIDGSVFWTDSLTVLKYINNETRRFKTFVGNRVAEVRESSEPQQWRHCPGPLNPADDATRGLPLSILLDRNNRWLHGPSFLYESPENWPTMLDPSRLKVDDADPEVKFIHTVVQDETEPLDPCNFSTLTRLIRVTALVLRMVSLLRSIRGEGARSVGPLTVADMDQGKKFWIKRCQNDRYRNEIMALKKPDPRSLLERDEQYRKLSRDSSILKLRPFLDDDNIIRVGGRLVEAQIPFGCKHQIILPPHHRVTDLFTQDCHVRLCHAGPEHIVSKMRETYWVPSQRPVARKVIKECRVCRRELSKPAIPKMAPLPSVRVTGDEPVWISTGCDLFGPFWVKVKRSRMKVWLIIFCSLSIRAVHFEILSSLTSDAFIMSLRRFISRRGEVKTLCMDRGTNFVGAEPELKEAYKRLRTDQGIADFLTNREIEFKFIPPKASHMGGAWERLIKSSKRAMRAVLRDHVVTHEVLYTILCEIESAMNSRPLCYVGNDPTHPTPLSPNHFLHHSDTVVLPADLLTVKDSACRKKWRVSQYIADQLWKRWRREYLPTLTIAQKWHSERRPLTIGDVILIIDWNLPRGSWPLARVCEVNVGRDGRIRSAKVKTQNGYLVRPVTRLCVLEESQISNY